LNINKRSNRWITVLLCAGSFIAARLFYLLPPGVFETWNSQVVDQFFVVRSAVDQFRPPYDDTIIHVDLNNTTIQHLDNFYLNRSHHARVIENLTAMGVAAQLFDFIFAAPSNNEDDARLQKAASKAGNVYFGMAFQLRQGALPQASSPDNTAHLPYLEQTKWNIAVQGNVSALPDGTNPLLTFPRLASAAKGLGYLNLTPDRDGVFRRLPLLVRYQDAFYPSLSLRIICDYLGVSPSAVSIQPGRTITLAGAKRPGSTASEDIAIPIDRTGAMIINYIGPWERMKHYNYVDVLRASDNAGDMELWRDELAGKIAVVSEVSTGTSDIGPVPTDAAMPLSAVHATALHTILSRSFIRNVSGISMFLIEAGLMLCILFLSLSLSSLPFTVGALLTGILYGGGAGAAFLFGHTIVQVVRPLLMIMFCLISIVVYRYIREEQEKIESLRQRDFVRATFGRYLSNEVVEELLGKPEGLKMSGETREVTFLVSDLRGFTSMTAYRSPREVVRMLNRFLEAMVEIIARYRGTVDEVQGDGMLVFFGAPLAAPDDPDRAVACAIEMQNTMSKINREQLRENLPELAMGIGINTGEVVVGNLGSARRAKYGAVGTPINMTYRIESYTTGGQILISPATYERVRPRVQVSKTLDVQLKGIEQPLTLYEINGIEGEYLHAITQGSDDSCAKLETALPIRYAVVENKTVSARQSAGSITHLGTSRARVLLEDAPPCHANLKILFASDGGAALPEVYAKLVAVEGGGTAHEPARGELVFGFLPDGVKAFLESRRAGSSV
jgi:adenylate cyclase